MSSDLASKIAQDKLAYFDQLGAKFPSVWYHTFNNFTPAQHHRVIEYERAGLSLHEAIRKVFAETIGAET